MIWKFLFIRNLYRYITMHALGGTYQNNTIKKNTCKSILSLDKTRVLTGFWEMHQEQHWQVFTPLDPDQVDGDGLFYNPRFWDIFPISLWLQVGNVFTHRYSRIKKCQTCHKKRCRQSNFLRRSRQKCVFVKYGDRSGMREMWFYVAQPVLAFLTVTFWWQVCLF